MPDRNPVVLPAGLAVQCTQYSAELACSDPLQRSIYVQLTASGLRVPGSPYFWRHWPREMGPFLTLLLQQIRCAAVAPRGAAMTHDRLAWLVNCHSDTIRLFIKWLREGGDPPFKVPGDAVYIRAVVQHYLPRIGPDPYYHGPGKAPYRYWTLSAEVIHRDHLDAFAAIDRGARTGQTYFTFPELWGLGLAGDAELVLSEGEAEVKPMAGPWVQPMGETRLNPDRGLGSDSEPMAGAWVQAGKPMAGQGVEPMAQPWVQPDPHLIGSLSLAKPKQLASSEPWGEESLYPDPARAADLLVERGLRKSSVDWLLKQPEGPYWATRWLVWIDHCRNVRSLRDVLYSTLRRAIVDRNPEDRMPPAAFSDWLEDRRHAAQRDARTVAAVADRPDPFRAQKSAPKPSEGTSVLPELQSVWERLLAGAGEIRRAMLLSATAVLQEGTTLVIELPTTNADLLKRYRAQLLEIAQAVHPDLGDLQFITPKGGR